MIGGYIYLKLLFCVVSVGSNCIQKEDPACTNMATTTDDGDYYASHYCVKDRCYEELAYSMEAKLLDDSPVSAKCCIFRAPEVLRRSNKKAYEPDVVSIGPFHLKKKSLQTMEKVKKWYLRTLLRRRNISLLSLIKGISEFESRARESYQELPLSDDTNEFLEMMVMDGCFLIELFRKREDYSLRSPDDPIFNMACIRQYIYHDLLLLENQLPFFVLQKLFFLTKENDHRMHSLNQLVIKFFRFMFSQDKYMPEGDVEYFHILDLVRYMLVGSYPNQPAGHDVGGKMQIPCPKLIPCVTSLLEAGIILRKAHQ